MQFCAVLTEIYTMQSSEQIFFRKRESIYHIMQMLCPVVGGDICICVPLTKIGGRVPSVPLVDMPMIFWQQFGGVDITYVNLYQPPWTAEN